MSLFTGYDSEMEREEVEREVSALEVPTAYRPIWVIAETSNSYGCVTVRTKAKSDRLFNSL